MSHVTTIKTRIKSIDALLKAAERCGLERRNKPTYKWYGRHVGDYKLPDGFAKEELGKCQFALGVKNNHDAYEIGVCRAKDGDGWVLLWDFWNRGYGLQDNVGEDAVTLRQLYAVEVAREQCQEKVLEGWEIQEVKQPNGHIQVKLVKDGGADADGFGSGSTSGGGGGLW